MSGTSLDPTHPADPRLNRRALLKGLGVSAAAIGLPGIAACGNSKGKGSDAATKKATGVLRFGVNANAAVPTAGYDSVFAKFKADTGIEVKPNKLLYTEQINNYLTAAPDDVLIWNAGDRMRFFAAKGLISDLSNVWSKIGSNVSDAIKKPCTADDGKQYLVPFYNYPWVVFYRKSVFAQHGYAIPKTFTEFKSLGDTMKKDGLTPLAFSDKEGWEAMGTFDILDMRLNGYQFHIDLLAGKESWADARVKEVFNTWRELLPYHQSGPLGRTWQEAAQSVGQKKAGMYLMGSFIVDQFSGASKADLDFFPFPEINAEHGQDSIDAPIDGFMMVKKPKNRPAAEALLTYLASGAAQALYLKTDKNDVGTAKDLPTSGYTPLQKKYAQVIAGTQNLAQYLDRDTRPDFSGPVVIPAIQGFLKNPGQVDGLVKSLQSQAKTIFAS